MIYNAHVASAFPWVVTYDILGLLFFNMVGATHFLFNVHNHAPSTAYVTTTRNLLFVSYYTNYVTRLFFFFFFCDVSIWLIMCMCEYAMSLISSIYRVDMGFINNYKESQLWLVILMYNTDVASVFPWVVTYDIKTGSIILCGLRDTTLQGRP